MTVARSYAFLGLAAAALLLLLPGAKADDTKPKQALYTPCMVSPVFVQPYISQPVIALPEIDKPTFVGSVKSRYILELPDIEPATFVQSVIMAPQFDGCSRAAQIRMVRGKISAGMFEKGVFPLTPHGVEPPSYGVKQGVSKVFTDADACCGGSMVGK